MGIEQITAIAPNGIPLIRFSEVHLFRAIDPNHIYEEIEGINYIDVCQKPLCRLLSNHQGSTF